MKGLLEYLKLENITHPSTSDVQIGMKIDEKYAVNISNLISNVFERESVTFNSRTNGIESSIVVVSETKQMQFTIDSNIQKYRYIILDNSEMLLESISNNVTNTRVFKKDLMLYGTNKGWCKEPTN